MCRILELRVKLAKLNIITLKFFLKRNRSYSNKYWSKKFKYFELAERLERCRERRRK